MPTNIVGTNGVADLYRNRGGDNAKDFGFENISAVIRDDLAYWNQFMAEQLAWLTTPVTVNSMARGLTTNGYWQELDEYGNPDTQKDKPGPNVDFPLRRYGDAVGFTDLFLSMATVGEVLDKYEQARKRHEMTVNREIQRALYTFNTDKSVFDKFSSPQVNLTVKGLVNADGDLIPDSQDFAGTSPEFSPTVHTHYLGITGSSVAASDLDLIFNTVTEHDHTRGVKLIVSQSNASAISALTGFLPAGDAGLISAFPTTQTMLRDNTTFTDLADRLIGAWRNSSQQIWIKPWAVAGYVMCVATDEPQKVLGMRQPKVASLQGARLVAQENQHPLMLAKFEHYFGFGGLNRTAGAILDITTGSNSYAVPTIARS